VVRRAASEGLGTAFLLAAVVGSGIMGDRLAGGSVAGFIAAQLAGAAAATILFRWLVPSLPKDAKKVVVDHPEAEGIHV
jgi:glycerol uptake facilitator-like aquaporin